MQYRDKLYEHYFSGHYASRSSADRALQIPLYKLIAQQSYIPWFPAGKDIKVLDCATGDGLLLDALEQLGYSNVYGIDISQEQVDVAHARGQKNIEQADTLQYLKGHENEFDVITAIDIVEHLTRDENFEFFEAIQKALKPGGVFIARTPNGGGPLGASNFANDLTHETLFSRITLNQALSACGFNQVVIQGADVKGTNWYSFVARAVQAVYRLWWRGLITLQVGLADAKLEPATYNLLSVAYKDSSSK